MTADGLMFLEWFFFNIWRFFTDWNIPGTGVTPAGYLLFLVLCPIVFNFIKSILLQDLRE